MLDSHNREINYLRVSVTDRCNLHCLYCKPKEGLSEGGRDDILSFEEIHRVIRAAVRLGITKVRLTGGEPLVRRGLADFIRTLGEIENLTEISLTTNGILLASMADEIRRAGIKRINISLDSLDKGKYARITGGGDLQAVLDGIDEACRLGFSPIKINNVAIKGFNDDEILDFAGLARERPFQVRFIELMPFTGDGQVETGDYLSNQIVREVIEGRYGLQEIQRQGENNSGPARIFRLNGGMGEIGFISPLSHLFCDSCNRLRLTSDGTLLSCLLYPDGIDLKESLRRGCSDEELAKLLQKAIIVKPMKHQISPIGGRIKKCGRQMYNIGG
ncbi:MAG: GTP 3',8-cyclase MoaA [Smithellaceae bacterium]|nr:GTP 3',8-cyclase MoaA [Smithellaceae bacterium]